MKLVERALTPCFFFYIILFSLWNERNNENEEITVAISSQFREINFHNYSHFIILHFMYIYMCFIVEKFKEDV